MTKPKVIVNLSRLASGSDGAGGAGLFGLFFARAAAYCADLVVFVNSRNHAMVAKFLADTDVKFLQADDINSTLVKSAVANTHVYVDPINGLEPEDIPSYVHAIAVIHDLMFLERPYFFTESEIRARAANYGGSISRADTVLTVSAQQQASIKAIYNKANVEWIAQPRYFDIQSASQIEKTPGGRFVIFPGVQWNHKNHFRLFAAFLGLCERGLLPDDMNLVFTKVRPAEDGTMLHAEIKACSIFGHRIKELPYLSQSDYAGFMRAAYGIVFPSLFEGYGIPVVEAVANGVPILTSRTPSLDSVRDLPPSLFVIDDASDIGSVARGLREFLHGEPIRAPAPDSVPSISAFNARVAELLDNAASLHSRGESARPAAVKALPANPRRANALTLHLWAPSPDVSELRALNDFLLDDISTTPIKAIIYTSFDFAMTPTAVGAKSGSIRFTVADAVAGSADIALTHELVMSSSRYNLVLPLREAAQLNSADLDLAVRLLAQAKDLNSLELFSAVDSLASWGEAADLLRGRLINVDRLTFDFDVSQEELVASLRARLRSSVLAGRPKFLVCDSSLVNRMGHHASVARSLAAGANALGFKAVVAGHRAAPANLLAPDAHVEPIFDDYLYGGKIDIATFAAQLEDVAAAQLIHSRSAVSLFCATPAMLGGAIAFLLTRDATLRPTFYIRFDRDESRTPRASLNYASCFNLISNFGLQKYFRFFVESKGLRNYFKTISGFDFDILLNSIDDVAQRLLEIGVVRRVEANKELVISYLGEARAEKGFQFLPVIVDYVLAQCGTDPGVRFRIQVSTNAHNATQEIKTARDTLAMIARKESRVELVGYLDDAAYLDAIYSSDIVILPYLPTEYVLRGSGVATEAAAIGKPIVVSRGTDISLTFGDGGVVVPDRQDEVGLATALCKLVEEYAIWSDRAANFRSSHRELFGDDAHMVGRLLNAEPYHVEETKYALWLSNDTRGEGSGVVYDAQLGFLRRQGYQVIMLVIPYPNHERAHQKREFDIAEFMSTLEWRPSFDDTPEYHAIADIIANTGNSYDNFVAAWGHLDFPVDLCRLLHTLKFDLVVVNYAHHAAVLTNLDIPRTMPWIVETHDVQCYQYALQQQREVDPREIKQELDALSAFDHLVSISASETKVFEAVGEPKVTWCLPNVKLQASSESLDRKFDLLVVGSDHDANVASIQWFIQSVYRPILYKEGLTLAVVGTVCGKLDQSLLTERISYLGRVPDLGPYYDAAKIVALPVIAGAGVPIKVLDAFARGKAFSLTRFPAAAIGLPEDFPLVDNAYEMAQDLLNLFDNEELQKARGELGRRFYEINASVKAYDIKWAQVLLRFGVPVQAPDTERAERVDVAPGVVPEKAKYGVTDFVGNKIKKRPPAIALALGREYDFETEPALSAALGAGWYVAEKQGVWSSAAGGDLSAILLPEGAAQTAEALEWVSIKIKCRVFGSLERGRNTITVSMGEQVFAKWEFDNDALHTQEVLLPVAMTEAGPMVNFHLHPRLAWSPLDIGIGGDPRQLGIWLAGACFTATSAFVSVENDPANSQQIASDDRAEPSLLGLEAAADETSQTMIVSDDEPESEPFARTALTSSTVKRVPAHVAD